ncbi:MAG: rhomboid family intramembrane serine protease [Flavobacteriales bacterium]|nr:rhomboid family intramembrane serine protease [Flavobacteriales bacterium]|tara:strand:- start:2049 stop:2705 length:657 start_codon:yes stop_codon:yes gene_type:complete
MKKSDKKEIFSILRIPFLFLLLMWLVKLIEFQFDLSLIKFGVFPQTFNGLKGIFFSPFIHKDLTHLFNNSYPILILGALLFSVYRKIAMQIFFWLFVISGFWLWIIGRPSFHIGASGIIYALASFLFISGVIRKNPRLAAVSLIIIFLYGSMIWGILPTEAPISWEGHLAGFAAGILVAIFYRDEGPKRIKYQWEIDEELEEKMAESERHQINYIVRK